jgi:hypothetical protein
MTGHQEKLHIFAIVKAELWFHRELLTGPSVASGALGHSPLKRALAANQTQT